jgi:hypothetical protein
MASVPRRETEAAIAIAAARPRPSCPRGRGDIPPMSGCCEACAHDGAEEFWKLMGLPCIPTELPPLPAAEPARVQSVPKRQRRQRRR